MSGTGRERKVNFDCEKDSSSLALCGIGSLVQEMYQQSEASKNLCCQLCVHVFGEPVPEMAIKSFSGTRMKIKCCRGLIKATQNIITLVQAMDVIIINIQPCHHKSNASTKAFLYSLEGLITHSFIA